MDGIKMKGEEKRKNQSKGDSGGNGVWGVSLGTLLSYRTVVAELKTEFEPFVNKAEKTERRRFSGYKEVYLPIRRYSPLQGLCRLFLFFGIFCFCLRFSRKMDFSNKVKDNIHFLKTLAVYLLRRMDNDFLYKFIDDCRR